MSVRLCLAGDVMTGRGVDQILPQPSPPRLFESHVRSARDYVALAERAHGPIPRPVAPAYVWGAALAIMQRERPDARIVNLETSVTRSEDAEPKGINYRMHPGNVAVLTEARIDCCTLANNHVLDWGVSGLRETLETLAHARVRVAGAGRTAAEARAPAVIDAGDGRRVLVFAFGAADSGIPPTWAATVLRPGVNLLPELSDAAADGIAALVGDARRAGDVVVASIHWGPNWGYDIADEQRQFAHALVDRARVDVVFGHSSHHAMAIEVHRGRPILYGCGDLLNDYEGIGGHERFRTDLVALYFVTLERDGALTSLELAPLRLRHFALQRADAEERGWLRDTLDRECARFGHGVRSRGDALVLDWR